MGVANKRHIELFNQNKDTDTISINLARDFRTPAIVISVNTVRESDIDIMKNSLKLASGENYLYVQLKGKSASIGKTDFTLDDFLRLTGIFPDCPVYKVTELDGELQQKEITLEDMTCTVILGEKHLRYNPELHVKYVIDHADRYLDIIYAHRDTLAEFEDYYMKNVDLFSELDAAEASTKQLLNT